MTARVERKPHAQAAFAEKARQVKNDHAAHRDGDENKLLSRDDIQFEYGLPKRWLELAALSGNGPPYVKISRRMVRYQRGAFEAWLAARTVTSTSMEVA